MKTRLLSIIAVLIGMISWSGSVLAQSSAAWTGEEPESGSKYYLLSTYTSSFMTNGNNVGATPTLWTLTKGKSGDQEVWTIHDQESTPHYLTVERTGSSSTTQKASNFSVYSNTTSTTTSSDRQNTFWLKGNDTDNGKEYSLNVYIRHYDAVFSSNDRYGDIYVGVKENATTLSAETRQDENAPVNDRSYWKFISEEQYNTLMKSMYYEVEIINNYSKSGNQASVDYSGAVITENIVSSHDQNITLHATPAVGYKFVCWASSQDESGVLSTSADYATTITSTSHDPNAPTKSTFYPIFKKDPKGSALVAGDFYLYNVGSEKHMGYVADNGPQVSVNDEARFFCNVTLTASGDKWLINTHYNDADNYIYYYSTDNIFKIDGATGDALTITLVPNTTDTYYIQSGENYLTWSGSGTTCVSSTNKDACGDAAMWKFIPRKKLRFVTYNVDGLPRRTPMFNISVNDNCPGSDGSKLMGQKLLTLNADVIGVQEDFDFDEDVKAGLGDGYKHGTHRGSFSWDYFDLSNRVLKSDGLNLFWKNEISADDEMWTDWSQRYGDVSNGLDQNILKGFRYYRVTTTDALGNPAYVDVFTLHMDADSDAEDIAARNAQWTQLATFINKINNGRPKIVMGDTNSRYTREQIKANFIDVVEGNHVYTVKDAWVETCRDGVYPACPETWNSSYDLTTGDYNSGTNEIVDKILYLNPNGDNTLRLMLTNFHIDGNFNYDENGNKVLDNEHHPVIADFELVGDRQNDEVDWIWIGETDLNQSAADGTQSKYYIYNDKFVINGTMGHFMHAQDNNPIYMADADAENATLFTFTKQTYSGGVEGTDEWNHPCYKITYAEGKYLGHSAGNSSISEDRPFMLNTQDDNQYYNIRSGVNSSNVASWLDKNSQFRYLNVYSNTGSVNFPTRDGVTEQTASEWWLLISPEQMNTYLDYVEAYNKAKAYLTSGTPANTEIKNQLAQEVYFATGRSWNSTEVTNFINLVESIDMSNLTIGGAKLGTFVAPYEMDVPVGVNAYKVQVVEGSSVLDTVNVGKTIPALTPVLIMAKDGFASTDFYGKSQRITATYTKSATRTATKTVSKDLADVTVDDCHLVGSLEKKEIPDVADGKSYLLQKQGEKVAFFRCKPDLTYKIGKNRCWLVAPVVNGNVTGAVKTYFLSWEDAEADAITAVEEENIGTVYDLSGRKVTSPRRGIYIKDGKKVLINK